MGFKSKLLISAALIAMMVAMVCWPAEAVTAARAALSLWWRMILPSLLPFFISAELLMRLGLLPRLSRLLDPLMWPLFRLPGAAALAVLLGFSSGFPGGAAITAGLWQAGQIDSRQGARLIAFTNNASPLYISVALAAGMLQRPSLAYALMAVHYGGNILIGLSLRFIAGPADIGKGGPARPPAGAPYDSLMEQISMGKLLKKAAAASFANVSLIGCYMTFFAVLLAMLKEGGVMMFLLRPLFSLGVPAGAAAALAAGLWEMSLGIEQAALAGLPLSISLPVIAAILAWGGFSVQAQVSAMVADTDISPGIYLATRYIHAGLSFVVMSLWCARAALPAMQLSALLSLPVGGMWTASLGLLGFSLLTLAALLALSAAFGGTSPRGGGKSANNPK